MWRKVQALAHWPDLGFTSAAVVGSSRPDASQFLQFRPDISRDIEPDCNAAMLAATERFRCHRHCAMFDVQSRCWFLYASGFPDQQVTRLRRQHA